MKKLTGIFATALLLMAAVSAFAQKSETDNGGNPTSTSQDNSARPGFIPDTTPPLPNRAAIMEGFDDITNLPGWASQNNSDAPGATDWFQGNPAVFPAHMGADDAYLAANFNNTGGSVISNWMMTPEMNLDTLETFSFWTRTVTGSTFPDRLEVRLSTNGASTDVGSAPTDVGDFTELLVEINPNLQPSTYPEDWTQFVIDTFSGYTGTGRIAFRYWVTDAGPFGANSDFIGIDTVETTEVTCTVNYVQISGVDGNLVGLHIDGVCDGTVDVRADATGAIVASGVSLDGSGSTYIYVDFVADSTYTVILPDGSEVTTNTATVPTLGEWGMIAFVLLLMGSGLVFLRRRRLA